MASCLETVSLRPRLVDRVATFTLSQSGTGVCGRSPQLTLIRMYRPQKTFGILYAIWCIVVHSGGSYLYAPGPGTFVSLR